MRDDELKKLLEEMKLDHVLSDVKKTSEQESEQEPAVDDPSIEENTSEFSWPVAKKFLLLASLVVFTSAASFWAFRFLKDESNKPEELVAQAVEVDGEQDNEPDDYELSRERARAWAQKINSLDPEIAKSVQVLWNMLERREGTLNGITDELSDLLYDNARVQQDFLPQQASILLSRYQSMNARLAFDISNQIYLIEALVKKSDNVKLVQAFNEFLAELGCQSFASFQMQITRQLVQQEEAFKAYVEDIADSNNLQELQESLTTAQEALIVLEKNGYAQTFLQLGVLKEEIAPAVVEALLHISEGGSDAELAARCILDQCEIEPAQKEELLARFRNNAPQNEPQDAVEGTESSSSPMVKRPVVSRSEFV